MNTLENMITYDDKAEEPIEMQNEELNNNIKSEEEEKEDEKEKEREENDIYKLNDINDIITSNENNNFENNDIIDNNKENNNNENNIDYNNINFDLNNNYELNNINNLNEEEKKLENGFNNSHEKENNLDIEEENNNIKEDNNNINNIADDNNDINNIDKNNIKENDINKKNENINNINHENIIDNKEEDNIVNNKDNKKKENKIEEKDIIDDLIEKIRAKEKVSNKENCRDTLNKLDEEVKIGLEKLNEIDTSKKSFLDSKKELKNEKYSINNKFNDLLCELNKTLNKTKNKSYYKPGTYIDYKNMKIIKPRIFLHSETKKPFKKYIKTPKRGVYCSSIDGKIIVNGERRDVSNSINNLNIKCDDMLRKSWNNFGQIKNWSINDYNFGTNKKNRIYSIRNKSREIDLDNIPIYRVRKINKYNKDYFKDELEKMNNLLFSNSNYRINNKFY